MRTLWALSLSLFAAGCGLAGQSKPARAQETALELNLNTRFGRMELAAEHVAPKAKDAFFERRRAWGTVIRVADYDMTGLKMEGEDDCETIVKVAWFRAAENNLHTTTLKQKWHDFKGDWKLTEETRLEGDVGLLGEPPEARPAGAAGAARRAQFPTITLGRGDLGVVDLPPVASAPPAASTPAGPTFNDPSADTLH